MATYKVPQDVEADDKLLGPFSFRQFIYLIIVALAGTAAWGLAQIFIGLAIIPLPIILFFGALALPLRKDQPMEIYLAALISFYLKPHRRLWDPDGVESLIEIAAPKITEEVRTKNLSNSEAEQRLNYLAGIVDSGGWAIRGANGSPNSAMISDVFYDAQNTQDVLDANDSVSQSFSFLMNQQAEKSRQETIERMRQAATPQPVAPQPVTPQFTQTTQTPSGMGIPQATPVVSPYQAPAPQPAQNPMAQYTIPATPTQQIPDFSPKPYTDTSHQKVIQPLSQQALQPAVEQPAPTTTTVPQPVTAQVPTTPLEPATSSTSDKAPSADIIRLATNTDLSIETIAKEASRLKKRDDSQDEFVISLR